MTTFLTVPFAEKDQAKSLGARWNAERKKWYVPAGTDLAEFKKWLGGATSKTAALQTSTSLQPVSSKPAPQMEHIGLTITGNDFVKLDHDCVPWLPCADCDAMLQLKR